MKNLATLNISEFTINENGEAFISQRAAARETGIPLSSLNTWVTKNRDTLNLNEINQLCPKSFQKLVKAGHLKNKPKCAILLDKFMEAGVVGYFYTMAGYTINAVSQPKTRLEIAQENVRLILELDAAQPAIALVAAIASDEENHRIGEFAKLITQKHGVAVGPNKLHEYFRETGVFMSGARNKDDYNSPYQPYLDNGHFTVDIEMIQRNRAVTVTKITAKGMQKHIGAILKHFEEV